MRKRNLLKRSLIMAVIAGIPVTAAAQTSETFYEVNHIDSRMSRYESRPGEVIVKLKSRPGAGAVRLRARAGKVSSSSASLETFLRGHGLQDAEQLMSLTGDRVSARRARGFDGRPVPDSDLSGLYALRFDSGDVQPLLEELRRLDDVEYAEPNYIVHACADVADYTADPLYQQQWGPAAIGLDKLWNVPVTAARRPVIAILDTGVDITHPDLADNIWTNTVEADGAEDRDDDGNGFTDDLHGWDFVNQTGRMRDNNGHGTHCAGIAAAVGGNGIGICGANPDALIMPVTVMQSNGSGDVATIIKGIDYAVANGADVISMSLGTYSESTALADALGKAYQKAVLVAAAGNDNLCIYQHLCPVNKIIGSPMFPAAYSFVLGVEASADAAGTLAGFSNYDEDGPITSTYTNLYNYELRAPGTAIQSTFPGGQYRKLNGTSMACPLVAGAISRLMSVKNIRSKEELFGDLIHTARGNIDIYSAYSLTDADRRPTLSLVTYRLDDAKMGDGDGRPDAGETIRFYPTFRNYWGSASNITYTLRLAENEDPDIVSFMDEGETHVISNLSSFASVEAENPFIFKVSPDCVDGRVISFVLEATCDNISEPLTREIQLSVENGVELGGVLKEDMTLTPDKNYIVTSKFAVPEGVTLTILPGTTIKIKDGMSFNIEGNLIAEGTPDHRISFTKADLDQGVIDAISFGNNILKYVEIVGLYFNTSGYTAIHDAIFYNSYFNYITSSQILFDHVTFNTCTITNTLQCDNVEYGGAFHTESLINTNAIKYSSGCKYEPLFVDLANCNNSNLFSNSKSRGNIANLSGGLWNTHPKFYVPEFPNYLGSSLETLVRKSVYDIHHPQSSSFGEYDLSNMLTRPVHEAHGIVWKVVVNGYDAQDEYELLPPLGVGRHKFEVYFNREMNHDKAPLLAMGVRAPYTQTVIAEDGSWRSETMENGDVVDVYTAYLTIRGRDCYDGVNTIYVADAEDNEYFPIPIEDVRFRVNVQSAGSMSSGFTAEPGVGKVTLTWENPEENFDDMLGYNMYRYTLGADDQPVDSVRVNTQLLTAEEFVDYDIVPGNTYCYYYKVLRTSLAENAASKVVSATPRAAGKGDADGSGDVDVADVVSEINYMLGEEQRPFIFDAADVNSDSEVDILDVVGTVNIIVKPADEAGAATQSMATYRVTDGILYIDCPVELAGVQVDMTGTAGRSVAAAGSLRGMETAGAMIAENGYRFVAFSLSGKTVDAGLSAIVATGGMDIADVRLVDTKGHRVMAMAAEETGISSAVGRQMRVPTPNPFHDRLDVPVLIGTEGSHDVTVSLTSLSGQTVMRSGAVLGYGEHVLTLDTTTLSDGFYLLVLSVDGSDVQTCKVIRR